MLYFIMYWLIGLLILALIGGVQLLDDYDDWWIAFCILILLALFWPMWLAIGLLRGIIGFREEDEQ